MFIATRLLFRVILEGHDLVVGVIVFGILAEVAEADELESLATLGGFQRRLYHGTLDLGQGVFVEEVQVGLALGHVGGVLDVEQAIIQHQRGGLGVLGGEPMDGALDLAAVGGHTAARLQIGGGVDALDRAVLVLFDLAALDDIATHEADLTLGLEAEELGRRHLGEVVGVDVDLTGHGNLTGTQLGLLRVVGQGDHLLLVGGVVVDDHLDGVSDGHAAQGVLIEIVADAGLQLTDIHGVVGVGHACLADEGEQGVGRIAAAAQTLQGGQTGVVPAVHVALLHQLAEVALGHDGVGDVHATEFPLMGLLLKANLLHHPVVQGSVVAELAGAEGVGNALQGVLNGVGEIVHGVYAPLVTLAVMMDVLDAVDDGIAEVGVVRGGVDLGAQGAGAVLKLTVLHALEQLQVLLHASVAVGRLLGGLGAVGALVVGQIVLGQVANVGIALLDELNGELVAFAEIVGAVEHAARGGRAQPLQILADGADELVGLLGRVGVVVAEVEQAAVLVSHVGVDADGLHRADVEITVGLGGKAGVDLQRGIGQQILVDDVVNKVGMLDFVFHDFLRGKTF